nr:hypothetical protein [Tanacetum cinerariifolium]
MGLEPPPAQYLVHQSLAVSRRHVAASYWTAASDVAATSTPINADHRRSTTVNTAGHRRSTPPATGQRRRITVVIGDQRWWLTMVNATDHQSTMAVNDGRRWRTIVDCRWTTVDHHWTTDQRWISVYKLQIYTRPLLDDYKKRKKINDLQLIMCGDMFKKILSQGEALNIVSSMEIVL